MKLYNLPKRVILFVAAGLLSLALVLICNTNGIMASTSIPPTVSTGQAQNIAATAATLEGNLTSLGSSSSVNVYFKYGTTTSYGMNTSSQVKTSTGLFSINISGLSQGTVYHFRAVADAGVNGSTVGADSTFFTTPIPPVAGTSSATAMSYTTATLRGNLYYLGTASTVSVFFEYGTTSSYGSSTSSQQLTATGAVSADLTNLTPGTVYHYRIKADGGIHGVTTGSDMMFTTMTAQPPQLGLVSYQNLSYSTVTNNSTVTLIGNLASSGTAPSVSVSFEYGTTTGYGSTIAATSPAGAGYNGGFSADVTGLQPGTTYHFRAKADGGLHGVAYSDDMTFTTLGTGAIPVPAVISSEVASITSNSATISGNLTSMGTLTSISVYFEYGTSTSYGSSTDPQNVQTTGTFSVALTGLTPGTLYHYRAIADDGIRYKVNGSDMTFTTSSSTPVVTTSKASGITDTSAVLTGTLVSLGTADSVKVFFEYGISSYYGKNTATQNATTTGSFNVTLTDLKPGTEYHYRIKADGGNNGIVTGDDVSFTTLTQSLVAIDSNSLVINPTTALTGDKVNISVNVTNTGSTAASSTLELSVNGISTDSQQITLQPGVKQQVTFTTVENIAGTYQISINGVNGSFTIQEKPETTTSPGNQTATPAGKQTVGGQMLLFIVVGVVIVVGLVIFLLRKFERK